MFHTKSQLPFELELGEALSGTLGDVAWPVIGWAPPPVRISASELVHSDVKEDDRELVLTLTLPGFDPKSLEVFLEGAALSIRARYAEDGELVERAFMLSAALDIARIKARFDEDEVLTIRVAKRPSERLDVNVSLA